MVTKTATALLKYEAKHNELSLLLTQMEQSQAKYVTLEKEFLVLETELFDAANISGVERAKMLKGNMGYFFRPRGRTT